MFIDIIVVAILTTPVTRYIYSWNEKAFLYLTHVEATSNSNIPFEALNYSIFFDMQVHTVA